MEFETTKASRKQEPGESQSIRIQAETKQQRHDRLQIARDNTARRLQLLQQNAAMYMRENKRLQHLQD